jgi:hypothetical protein
MFAGQCHRCSVSRWIRRRLPTISVQTIKKERIYLKVLFIVKFIPFFRGLPPLFDRLDKMMGFDEVMDNFRGH